MKKLKLLLLLALGIAAVSGNYADAQMVGTIDFTTDFPFYAGNTLLPAGSYQIRKEDMNAPLLVIESEKLGKFSAFIDYIPMRANNTHAQTDVVFQRYGDREYLSKLWLEGQRFGMQVEKTKAETRYVQSKSPSEHSVTGKKHDKR